MTESIDQFRGEAKARLDSHDRDVKQLRDCHEKIDGKLDILLDGKREAGIFQAEITGKVKTIDLRVEAIEKKISNGWATRSMALGGGGAIGGCGIVGAILYTMGRYWGLW